MTRPWNLDTKERPAARHLCALPADRLPPFIFVRQVHFERTLDLALAGLLLTHFPRRRGGRLLDAERAVIERVQSRLCVLRRAGKLPADVCSVWTTPDEAGGRCTPTSIQSEAWLRSRMARYATFSLRVERTPGLVH